MSDINYKKVKITTDYITLGQFLKLADLISFGGEAKFFIQEHSISVNGEDNKQRGKKLYPTYKVSVDNSLFFEISK